MQWMPTGVLTGCVSSLSSVW